MQLKDIIKNTLLLTSAVSFIVTAGCGKKAEDTPTEVLESIFDEKETENRSSVYGDVIHEESEKFSIPVSYDDRFVTEDMAKVTADYFYSIQEHDTELYKASTVDFYQDYLINEVYSEGSYNDDTFLDALYLGIENVTGGEFTIDKIEITDFASGENSGVENIYSILDELSGDDFSADKIQDGAELTLSFELTSEGSEFQKSDETVYLIKYDDSYHLITG